MKTVDFQVAFGAVKHFGRNLYTTNPPAIAELIANSWDAYATECSIYENNGALLICDNGIGMTDEEFSKRYAVSGMEKKLDIRIPESVEKRPYMGRKGIGKFSAFSLGEEYILYTKAKEEDSWKTITMNYSDLLVNDAVVKINVDYEENLNELESNFSDNCDLSKFEHGTFIYIPKMRRKFIKSSKESLSKILARRFSVNISQKYSFDLFLNGDKIDLKEHFYYDRVEFIYYFGYTFDEIKLKFPNIKSDDYFIESTTEWLSDNGAKGWVGSVNKTEDLKVEEELNSSGIIVYINGKLADENILKTTHNARVSNLYVVGEVDADFLQDENEDPVLSSREGLNLELENVELLKKDLTIVRQKLINSWDSLRASRDEKKQNYLQIILQDDIYQGMYNQMKPNEKKSIQKYAQKLFDKDDDENSALIKYYTPILFSIVNSEIINQIQVDSDDDLSIVLSKFYDLFDKTELNNALRLKSNIQDRLAIVDELQQHIDDNAREKIFEQHLADNPWLINPYWDKKTEKIQIQNKYDIGHEAIGITDIIVEVAEEPFPIIVELKREGKTGYSSPDVHAITTQVNKYRMGIIKKRKTEFGITGSENIYGIKAYFICGDHVLDKMDSSEIQLIKEAKIEILTYSKIIHNAHGMYYQAINS